MERTKKLATLIQEIENYIPYFELKNERVSNAAVGWHIAHILLTMGIIIGALESSKPSSYKRSFSLQGFAIMKLKWIPRGRAKAPAIVLPTANFNAEMLRKNILFTKRYLKKLDLLDENSFFLHPHFGNLRLKSTIKFLAIHSNHHIKIINDIIKLEKTKSN